MSRWTRWSGSSQMISSCVLLVFITFFFTLTPVSAKEAGLTYDELQARELQHMENPSFEESKPGQQNQSSEIIVAPEEAKHGTKYLKVTPKNRAMLFKGVKRAPTGKLRFSLWVKGHGRVIARLRLLRKNWRNKKPKFFAKKGTDWRKVNTDTWKKITFETTMPETAVFKGKKERPEASSATVLVRGSLKVDQMSVVRLADLQKATRSATPKTDAEMPLVSVPRFSKAPAIDGELSDDEWDGAAAVTGFTELETIKLASRQTTAYIGYDNKRLYVAYRCTIQGKVGKGKAGRDIDIKSSSDAVELWLVPPGKGFIQFMGTPSGGFLDQSKSESLEWNADWKFANSVRDSGEKVGNILSFQKKIWTAELSVPFSELGASVPSAGDKWHINFTRDLGMKEGKRGNQHWTTWSPIKGSFDSIKQFGTAVFRPEAPAVQFTRLGELSHGQVLLEGRAEGPVRIQARTNSSNDGKTFTFNSTELKKGLHDFKLSDTVQVNKSTDLRFHAKVVRSDTGQLIAGTELPFTAKAVLTAKAIPVFWKDKLFLSVDATRVGGLPAEEVTVEATIYKGETATDYSTTETWSEKPYKGDLSIDISGLPAGEYRTRLFLRDEQGGKELVSSIVEFTKPEPPSWADNNIGVSEKVPEPWTPVKIDGNTVKVIDRTYQISPVGLPESIRAKGKALFAAQPQLNAVVDGKEVSWDGPAPKLIKSEKRKAVWKIRGTAGPLSLEGTLTIEFDGFALWDVTVSSDRPVTVNALHMEFPFKPGRSLYARSRKPNPHPAFLAWKGKQQVHTVRGMKYCLGGWPWTDKWSPEMWVGDDHRGMAVMSETDENVKGQKRIEIDQSAEARTLKIHLIDGPYTLEGDLSYMYMWQGTPIRPMPDNPKIWHASYRAGKLRKYLKEGRRNEIYTVVDMWALADPSYPSLKQSRSRPRYIQKRGTKAVPYFGTNQLSTEIEMLQPLLPGLKLLPERMGSSPGGSWTVGCLKNPSMVDYMAWAYKGVVDKLGFNGVYLDVSGIFGCKNKYHGCGYVDSKTGKRVRTHPILGNRALYKRLYTFNKSGNRDAILFRHSMPVAAVAGFVDVVTQGEAWVKEHERQYDRLTPELFRILLMKNQYGTPYTWYAHHHYWRGKKWGRRVPLNTILAYCLPHHILPTVGRIGMWPVWKVTDKFWTDSGFLPYWSEDCPVSTNQPGIYATIYRKKQTKEAWLVVSNWKTDWKKVQVRIDIEKLGIGSNLSFKRAIKHPIRQPEDPQDGDPMQNRSLRYRNGVLPLRISGRNLEVIRIEGQ